MFQELTNDAISLLQNLIAIPSFSKDEKAAADFLEKYIEEKGYIVSRKDNNIWLMNPGFDSVRPTILLNSHIDTVKPVSAWVHDPFFATIENGKLFGLGSNDAGASVLFLLQAFF
ncbi:MAG: M20/M25/M40 family metallo-hydrolase, partial [Paludibacter sp.]